MLLLVLVLVLIAFGLLVVALLSGSALWAWVSVAVSVVAAIVLLIDWLQRRAAVRSADRQQAAQAAAAPGWSGVDADPVTEQIPAVRPDVAAPTDVLPAETAVVGPAAEPSVSPQQPSSAPPWPPQSRDSESQRVVKSGASSSEESPAVPGTPAPVDQAAAAGRDNGAEPSEPPTVAQPAPPVAVAADIDDVEETAEVKPVAATVGAAEGTSAAAAGAEEADQPAEADAEEADQPAETDTEKKPEDTDEPAAAAADSQPATTAVVQPAVAAAAAAGAATAATAAAMTAGSADSTAGSADSKESEAAAEPAEPADEPAEAAGPPAADDSATEDAPATEQVEQVSPAAASGAPAAAADAGQPPVEMKTSIFEKPGTNEQTVVFPVSADAEPPEEPRDPVNAALVAELVDVVVVIDERPRYHVSGCRFLPGKTEIPLPVKEAVELGFTPCGWCNPDRTLSNKHRATSSR